MKYIKLNNWIDRFSEIKPKLDQELESLDYEYTIENEGCSNKVVNQVVKYLKDHDCQVTVESKGAAALNRIFG